MSVSYYGIIIVVELRAKIIYPNVNGLIWLIIG